MHAKTSFAIIGTGAVGGYYGGLLQRAGFDVHFLLRSDFDHVAEKGLRIDSVQGGFHLPKVNVYTDPKKMPRCNVVIIALKTTDNHALPNILPYVVKDNGIVLTLQNGLGSEEDIANYVNADQILGGLCFLCSNKVGAGHIRHLDYGLITLGEYRSDGQPGEITPRLKSVGADLKSAGISTQLIEDLALARWKKLVWNIPFNGLSVVQNVLTNELVKNPTSRLLCETLMNEVASASKACARPINPEFIQKMITYTEKMKAYAPSMKLDFDRGKPMEIESIYGEPLRRAKSKGITMPETERLYHQLLELNSTMDMR